MSVMEIIEKPECPWDDGSGTHRVVAFWGFRDQYECLCGKFFKKQWPPVKRPGDD